MRAVLDSDPAAETAPAPPEAHEVPSSRPGPLAWTAWILFFAVNFLIATAPYLATLLGGKGAPLQPGMLDDPQMIVYSVVGAIGMLAIVGVLAWRSRLTRKDMGLVTLPSKTLWAWAGGVFENKVD